jgi:hypothetical protein
MLMLGPVATLVAEGTEKSQKVFSAICSGSDGAWTTGSVAERMIWRGTMQGQTLLTSFSVFSMKFVGKGEPVVHYPIFIQAGENKSNNSLYKL